MLDRLKNYDELGPTIDQNRFKNGATWCQNGVQDGLFGTRAVKRRSWTDTPTVTPEASWGHVGAHVGLMLASFFVVIF